jgi:hypothetical protein
MTTLFVHNCCFLSLILIFARCDHAVNLVVKYSDLVVLVPIGWLSLDIPQVRI